MDHKLSLLIDRMIDFYAGDAKRIQHFIKVHAFASHIGIAEGLDTQTQLTLEAAALVHDIGIKPAEEKYGQCGGKLQEQEGPPAAEVMLQTLDFESALIQRVCFLVGHHHTYSDMSGMDYQILVESDFLVNLYEDALPPEAASAAYTKIFRTEHGKLLCRQMFGMTEK